MFPIADVVKNHRFNSLDEAPAVKRLFFDLIVKYRKMKNRGVVAEFRKDRFDYYSNFARIGQGSLGGKGVVWHSSTPSSRNTPSATTTMA